MNRPFVIIESPYAGDTATHIYYAREACKDALRRGEHPFASHLLYTQFLDDRSERERVLGISFGYYFWSGASHFAFYTDNGWSPGMKTALHRCIDDAYGPIHLRSIRGVQPTQPDDAFVLGAIDRGFTFVLD